MLAQEVLPNSTTAQLPNAMQVRRALRQDPRNESCRVRLATTDVVLRVIGVKSGAKVG
jgi:hypothetical protein